MKPTAKKYATKSKPHPKSAAEPSVNASPRFKRLVAETRGHQDAAPTATAAEDAPSEPPPAAPAAIDPATYLPPVDADPAAGHPPFRTLRELGASYFAHLAANDASLSTRASYAHDFDVALAHFGPEADPAALTAEGIAAFESSDAVLRTKTGRPKSPLSIAKTRRVLRLALTHACDVGRLARLPYPKQAPRAARPARPAANDPITAA